MVGPWQQLMALLGPITGGAEPMNITLIEAAKDEARRKHISGIKTLRKGKLLAGCLHNHRQRLSLLRRLWKTPPSGREWPVH